MVPAYAEIILEGHILPQSDPRAITPPEDPTHPPRPKTDYEIALKGPYGDHTGYYNEQEWFPVFTVERITMRKTPIFHSTYTGKPPDEPAILGEALNEVFIPLLQKRSEEHTSELQSRGHLVCRLLLEKKKKTEKSDTTD